MKRKNLIMAVVRHLGIHKQPIENVAGENMWRARRKGRRIFFWWRFWNNGRSTIDNTKKW